MKTRTSKRIDRRARAGVHHTMRAAQAAYTAAPDTLPTVGHADAKHFPIVADALYVADPRTGKGVHLCDREQAVLFAALNAARDNGSLDAAHLAARLDAL
ncbi:MAG: hypothetical protein H7Y38_12470 [Armatimonadetes bacterium]|nr:hypothetical protein [Armatimonadota bacterium]